jgi:hypothetical protein
VRQHPFRTENPFHNRRKNIRKNILVMLMLVRLILVLLMLVLLMLVLLLMTYCLVCSLKTSGVFFENFWCVL